MYKRTTGEVVETATEARQGRLGRPVLGVLIASVVLAVIILGALWGWGFWNG